MKKKISIRGAIILTTTFLSSLIIAQSNINKFLITDKNGICTIIYDKDDYPTVIKSAECLAKDIELICGKKPNLSTTLNEVNGNVIILGSVGKSLHIKNLVLQKKLNTSQIAGKWETYSISFIKNPNKKIDKAMVIAGSDRRGTAYGIFHISELIGVSPWYWWADVIPDKHETIQIESKNYISNEPSVKYRGIFLNDEDWGLQPWAAKTYEPKTGDIGPKTYERIFELLLRLKANTIWPAMHNCTKAFYYYPDNKLVADTFGIIVGSSHAEPMLRNNVDEWDKAIRGDYNYKTNRENVYIYWKERAIESSPFENIYTLGMRGIHDSEIEGMASIEEKVKFLEQIIKDQREILANDVNPSLNDIPQVFTNYKEVLDIYDNGLVLPEDVTIIWPDDNYGYIQRQNSQSEMLRNGGSGVYYHASYWGRPHDYLWLGTTHPGLIREEMMKAYNHKANRIWILNVGDIKSIEYSTQLFLDMAYDISEFRKPESEKAHLQNWITSIFGKNDAREISLILFDYYNLAFERRPEFMGWNQVEPIRTVENTTYNHFYFGDQAQKRIDSYNRIMSRVNGLYSKVKNKDAFFQLIYYPVICSGLINKKILNLEKAYLYARQNRASANDYSKMSAIAYDSIVLETIYYNNILSKGKWENIMSMEPRNLPVFEKPLFPEWAIPKNSDVGISIEGDQQYRPGQDIYGNAALPVFSKYLNQEYFIDIFLKGNLEVKWYAKTSDDWIRLDKNEGKLENQFNKKQQRLWIKIDRDKINKNESGKIEIQAGEKKFVIDVKTESPLVSLDFNGFIESNGYISVYASDYNSQFRKENTGWETISGPGYTEKQEFANIDTLLFKTDSNNFNELPYLEYDLYIKNQGEINIDVYGLPVHPVNKNSSLRFAVGLNEEMPEILDFKTYGRSEEWKLNVLSNSAVKRCHFFVKNPGRQVLKIYAIDPSVIIERIRISTGKMIDGYGLIPETKIKK